MREKMPEVLALLRKRYPAALIVTEPVEGGMRRPCLQLLLDEASLKHEMGSRWRLGEGYTLNYYPLEGEDPAASAEELLLLAGKLFPRGEVTARIEGGILRTEIRTEEVCFLTHEEAEKMKRELLVLHLKWQAESQGVSPERMI